MARARWLTVKAEPLALAVGAALLAALTASPARAEVSLVPAQDGQLGAWLVAGPATSTGAKALDPSEIVGAAGFRPKGFPAFRIVSTKDGALDLDRALGARQKPGAVALLAGDLVLAEDLDGLLLLSLDGAVSVFVDGKPLFARETPRLRGSSWDAVPLRVAKGRHHLLLRLAHPGRWWAGELRILDARDLLAPRGARLALPGTDDADGARLVSELLSQSLALGASPRGYEPVLRLDFRRGVPEGFPLAVRVGLDGEYGAKRSLRAGNVASGPRGVQPFELSLPPVSADRAGSVRLRVEVGPAKLTLGGPVTPEVPELLAKLAEARQSLTAGAASSKDAETLDATLEWLESEVRDGGGSARVVARRILDALAQKRDPLRQPGVIAFARRSPVDGRPDPAVVHVPAGFSPGGAKRYPLVVALHGLNGTPNRIVEVFLDQKSSAPSVDGFVLAPHAHGNAFYRGPGELEVMAAIDWALETYPIDPARISITGVSMGGTGTSHLALRYADRFSAAAPLCGYHSYFVRRDTSGRPIRPWERDRMHHWSPASWAERGRNLPMWIAHGTKDFPLENSKVLVARYKELGYSMTDEWPDTGHDVWTKAYAGARLFPWLARAKLDPSPAHVTVKTDSLRFGHTAWARITGLATPGHMSSLDASANGPSRATVQTEGVSAFELERSSARFAPGTSVSLEVDGKALAFAGEEPIECVFRGDEWQKGKPERAGKRAGLEGPIRDVFLEPLVFSYGTLDPRTARANREVAETFARTRNGPEVAYRVVADRDLDERTEATHAVFAVGTVDDHLLLARVRDGLLVKQDGKALMLGPSRFSRPGTGAIFVQPNPRHPDRYLAVITGVDAAGIWRALSLPQLLPDFLVYDDSLAPAASEIVLGANARVLAGGFFDASWRAPSEIRDPEATAAGKP